MLGKPKYQVGDTVTFRCYDGQLLTGEVYIQDAYGTFEQNKQPSYDILVKGAVEPDEVNTDGACLYKHIVESSIL